MKPAISSSVAPATLPLEVYETLFRVANEIICIIDGNYKLLMANPAFLKFFDADWPAVYHASLLSLLPLEAASLIKKHADVAFKKKEAIYNIETKIFDAQNNVVFHSWDILCSLNADTLYLVAKDVTTQRLMEEKYRTSAFLLEQAQSAGNIGSWEVNLVNHQVSWSEKMLEIHEVDRSFLPDRENIFDFYDAKTRTLIDEAANQQSLTGKPWDVKVKMNTAKGNQKWIRIIGKTTLQNNRPTTIYGVFQDITKDVATEERLRHFQQGLKALNAIASNSKLDFSHQLAEGLRLASRFLALPVGIIGKIKDDVFQVTHMHQENSIEPNWVGHTFPVAQVFCADTLKNKDVTTFIFEQQVQPPPHICDALQTVKTYIGAPVWLEGEKYGTISFVSFNAQKIGFSEEDIEFTRLLARWVGAVLERENQENQLVLAKEAAEKALLAKSEFLSTMSHEIRTPMNAVVGLTNLLLTEKLMPSQEEKLRVLKFSAENLMVLINDILDYNKLESGKIMFDFSEFSLPKLIEQLQESFQHKAQEKGIVLRILLDTAIPERLMGDSLRLIQVLSNLMGNAIKFTDVGEVALSVSKERESSEEIMLFFQLKDTGIGIPKDKQAIIFDRFTQAYSDTTRKYGGTGLGLAIVKKILELHGEHIILDSQPGRGSTFSFRWSLKLPKSQNTQPPKQYNRPDTYDLMNAKILVAEDNMANKFVIKSFLEQWNACADFAENGSEALAKIKDRPFDLVLMDLQMPEMDGYQATRKIKDDPLYGKVPIIALTASNMDEAGSNGLLQAGFADFITKPFQPDTLYEKITNQLKKTHSLADEKSSYFSLQAIYKLLENDEELVKEYIGHALDEINKLETALPSYWNAGEIKQLRMIVHGLKPLLKTVGHHYLLDALTRLVDSLKFSESNENHMLLENTLNLLIHFKRACNALYQKLESTAAHSKK